MTFHAKLKVLIIPEIDLHLDLEHKPSSPCDSMRSTGFRLDELISVQDKWKLKQAHVCTHRQVMSSDQTSQPSPSGIKSQMPVPVIENNKWYRLIYAIIINMFLSFPTQQMSDVSHVTGPLIPIRLPIQGVKQHTIVTRILHSSIYSAQVPLFTEMSARVKNYLERRASTVMRSNVGWLREEGGEEITFYQTFLFLAISLMEINLFIISMFEIVWAI